jgi:general secretion pathway protein K
VILPDVTTVNVNTAAKPLLMALFPDLDEAMAERFMQLRLRAPWRDVDAINSAFTDQLLTIDRSQIGVATRYFLINGQVRLMAGTGAARATEVSITTLVERLAQANRTRIVRRDVGCAMPAMAP